MIRVRAVWNKIKFVVCESALRSTYEVHSVLKHLKLVSQNLCPHITLVHFSMVSLQPLFFHLIASSHIRRQKLFSVMERFISRFFRMFKQIIPCKVMPKILRTMLVSHEIDVVGQKRCSTLNDTMMTSWDLGRMILSRY